MRTILMLGAAVVVAATGMAAAADVAVSGYARPDLGQVEQPCYQCIRDAIYADTRLIAHLEANPDIDDAVKEPQIAAARADMHRLRVLLGPLPPSDADPCCYSRPRLYVR